MAIVPGVPNTVHLGGPKTEITDLIVIDTGVLPGDLMEYHNNSGSLAWGVHDSADEPAGAFVAIEEVERNKGVDDAYVQNSLIKVYHLAPGATAWMWAASGAYSAGALLQSNGDGKLKALGSGQAKFVALEAKTVSENTRIRVEVI